MTFKLCNKRFLQGTLTTLGNYWLVFSTVSSSLRLPVGVHLNKAGEHRGLGARENRRMGGGSSRWVGSGRNMGKVCNNA